MTPSAEELRQARANGTYDQLAALASESKCVFCDLREKFIISEDSGVVLTVNLAPYTDGHTLIIPRRHIERVDEMTDEEYLAQRRLAIPANFTTEPSICDLANPGNPGWYCSSCIINAMSPVRACVNWCNPASR